ncbi:MAG: hypothetical protein QXI16_00555 [Sulfolobaceae archaeon]
MERYFKITNGINTEVYDTHYTLNQGFESFLSQYRDSDNDSLILDYITKEEYLDHIIEKRRKEIKFI